MARYCRARRVAKLNAKPVRELSGIEVFMLRPQNSRQIVVLRPRSDALDLLRLLPIRPLPWLANGQTVPGPRGVWSSPKHLRRIASNHVPHGFSLSIPPCLVRPGTQTVQPPLTSGHRTIPQRQVLVDHVGRRGSFFRTRRHTNEPQSNAISPTGHGEPGFRPDH